jgi:hypothetical protein
MEFNNGPTRKCKVITRGRQKEKQFIWVRGGGNNLFQDPHDPTHYGSCNGDGHNTRGGSQRKKSWGDDLTRSQQAPSEQRSTQQAPSQQRSSQQAPSQLRSSKQDHSQQGPSHPRGNYVVSWTLNLVVGRGRDLILNLIVSWTLNLHVVVN